MKLGEETRKRRRARKVLQRMQRWQFGLRLVFRQRAMERYGLDVTGDAAAVADCRRRLRNARKQERRARR